MHAAAEAPLRRTRSIGGQIELRTTTEILFPELQSLVER
jgi:hypothetical protein